MTAFRRTRRLALLAKKKTLIAARPTWVSGAARLMDMGGVFDRYAYRVSTVKSDEQALAGDWARVGSDLRRAIKAVGVVPKGK